MLFISKPITIFGQYIDKIVTKYRNTFVIYALSFLCLYAPGCMQFSLVADGDKDEMTKNGDVYFGSYYNFWWGDSPEEAILKDMEAHRDENSSRSLYQVMYTSNCFYSFASLFSLGLFVPIDVRWYLVAPSQEEYLGPIRRKEKKGEQ